MLRRYIPYCFFLLTLVATFFVYQPGLYGSYMFDDVPNITKNVDIQISDLKPTSLNSAAFSTASGPLGRPISMVTFALNYYLTGFDPFYFKLTNLVIHMMNGIGIFILSILLLNAYKNRYERALSEGYVRWLSLAVASVWLLHPFNLTSVLYVVQRMTSLSTFFSIWGLIFYLYGRSQIENGWKGILTILASTMVFLPLGMFSKENGALLPIFMLTIEITLFKFRTEKLNARRFLIGFFICLVAIPAAAAVFYVATHPDWLMSAYLSRDFNLLERVMTEARVLWFYMRLIVFPSIAQMGLFHDDISISRGLFQPISTLFALFGIFSLLVLAFIVRRKAPLLTFGLLFYFSGHLLESTIFPFEIAHEHRNYLPMYGLLLVMFFYLLYPLKYLKHLRLRQILTAALISLFAFDTYARASQWANPFDLAINEVNHHPNSVRNNNEIGNVYGNIITADPVANDRNYLIARHYFEQTILLDDNYLNGLVNLVILSSARGKDIDPDWITKLKYRFEHSPASITNGDLLNRLLACQYKQNCKLDKNDLEDMLQAAMRNPTLTGSKKVSVISALTYYLINIKVDYPEAINSMKQALEISPRNLDQRLTFIKFLIALDHKKEATEQLAIMRGLDTLHLYSEKIEIQRKRIDDSKE